MSNSASIVIERSDRPLWFYVKWGLKMMVLLPAICAFIIGVELAHWLSEKT